MILTPLKKSFWSCTFKFFIYSKRFYKKSHQKCLFAWKLQIQILFSEFHQRFGTHELILTRNVSRLAISLSILKIKIRVRKLPRGKVMLTLAQVPNKLKRVVDYYCSTKPCFEMISYSNFQRYKTFSTLQSRNYFKRFYLENNKIIQF